VIERVYLCTISRLSHLLKSLIVRQSNPCLRSRQAKVHLKVWGLQGSPVSFLRSSKTVFTPQNLIFRILSLYLGAYSVSHDLRYCSLILPNGAYPSLLPFPRTLIVLDSQSIFLAFIFTNSDNLNPDSAKRDTNVLSLTHFALEMSKSTCSLFKLGRINLGFLGGSISFIGFCSTLISKPDLLLYSQL